MSFDIIKKFEAEIAEFYGAPYAVGVDSCTHALELCLRYIDPKKIEIPTHTYLSVAFLGEKLGIEWEWKEDEWSNYYYIGNTNIIDAAVYWKKDCYIANTFMCLSFQFQKHLNIGKGGMILTDDKYASIELKKMSHDGRNPDVPWREQNISTIGYHYNMTPEIAENGLNKLTKAKEKKPRSWKLTDWPDLREMDIFK
tara:strand:- start:856 stop:1446 length:591 start_codon:yes stop_codon:yes gene_type:complete